jgi:hypothetical protein
MVLLNLVFKDEFNFEIYDCCELNWIDVSMIIKIVALLFKPTFVLYSLDRVDFVPLRT